MNNKRNYLGNINIYDYLNYGAYSNIYQCDYLEALFAYKEYWNPNYVAFIKERLEKLADYYDDKRFVFPLAFIYKNQTDKEFLGYVMDYLYNYQQLCELKTIDYNTKIKLLKKCRDWLEIFHQEYKFIHTDICPWNFLYNQETDDIKLIDFDTYIDLNNKETTLGNYYNSYAQDYGNIVGIDKDLDIFLFNLTTFAILTGIEYNDSLQAIHNNQYQTIENQTARQILSGYKNLECKKTLKKEYVIDYL